MELNRISNVKQVVSLLPISMLIIIVHWAQLLVCITLGRDKVLGELGKLGIWEIGILLPILFLVISKIEVGHIMVPVLYLVSVFMAFIMALISESVLLQEAINVVELEMVRGDVVILPLIGTEDVSEISYEVVVYLPDFTRWVKPSLAVSGYIV